MRTIDCKLNGGLVVAGSLAAHIVPDPRSLDQPRQRAVAKWLAIEKRLRLLIRQLLRKGSNKVDIAALRTPERARLYLPILEGNGRYESGPVEFRVKDKTAQITVSASFLLPDGRTVSPAPLVWTPDTKRSA